MRIQDIPDTAPLNKHPTVSAQQLARLKEAHRSSTGAQHTDEMLWEAEVYAAYGHLQDLEVALELLEQAHIQMLAKQIG